MIINWNTTNIGTNVKIIDHETIEVKGTSDNGIMSNIGKIKPGRYYYEMTFTSPSVMVGICIDNINNHTDSYSGKYGWYFFPYYGYVYNSGTYYECGSSLNAGDILGVMIDLYKNKLYFSGNGNVYKKEFDIPKDSKIFIALSYGSSWSSSICKINYGQNKFKYKPKGYIAFNQDPPKYLIKKNEQLYSINQEYFKDGKFNDIGNTLNDDIISKSSDNLQLLYSNLSIGKITICPIEYFDKFKLLIYKEDGE